MRDAVMRARERWASARSSKRHARSASGGVTLDPGSEGASNLVVSGTKKLIIRGIGSSGQDGATLLRLRDSYHRPYVLDTLRYRVDVTAPVVSRVNDRKVRPGSNAVFGIARDESPIARVEVEVNGALTQCTQLSVGVKCDFIATGGDGALLSVRFKATDVHGNVGFGPMASIRIDAHPPQLRLLPEALAALADGRLNKAELALPGSLPTQPRMAAFGCALQTRRFHATRNRCCQMEPGRCWRRRLGMASVLRSD